MSAEPRDHAALDALAQELDRWSAYASGAMDDARVRHRHTREAVRRAERSLALTDGTVERDREALADAVVQLDRLDAEYARLSAELEERARLNAELIADAREVMGTVDEVLRENLLRQERAASAVSTTNRDEQRARARLHRALDEQRAARGRRLRRGGRDDVAAALTKAETDARQTLEAANIARQNLALLRSRHEGLVAEQTGMEPELAEAEALSGRLEVAAQALGDARQALADARVTLTRATDAHAAATQALAVMRDSTEDAVERFGIATQWEQDATGTYEDAQQLASDAALAIRDLVARLADVQRAAR